MPPAISPITESLQALPEAGSPYLQQLAVLSRPVPDLAATLSTHLTDLTTQQHDHDMTSPEPSQDTSLRRIDNGRQPYLTENEFRHFTSESRRRLARNLNYRPAMSSNTYAGWAPGSEEDNARSRHPLYRFERSNISTEHLPRESNHWEELHRTISSHRARRAQVSREPREEPSGHVTLPSWTEELRSTAAHSGRSLSSTAALLQSVERHRRYNERARTTMQDFILDRDRLSRESEAARTHAVASRSEKPKGDAGYIRLKNMLTYLSQLRHCNDVEESLMLASKLDINGLYSSPKSNTPSNLLLETSTLTQPHPSCWLEPGAAFTGIQHAPNEAPALLLSRDRDYLRRMVANRNINMSMSSNITRPIPSPVEGTDLTAGDAPPAQPSSNTNGLPAASGRQASSRLPDQWPVKVTFHDVDFSKMTLNGTMSASHIPDRLPPSSADHRPDGSSMESYFEGEIIDFRKHSLETENFRSDGIDTDVVYWSRIGPFKDIREQLILENEKEGEEADWEGEIAKCLADRQWIERVLMEEWVLMRWKERCFVADSNAGWGLTISGFYYIALHRQSGKISGLYYDPGSQPYQQLSMLPEGTKEGSDVGVRREWPAYEFR